MISAKAYGKILVFGAYSILEPGNIGLVVNVDKGTKAEIEKNKEFELSIPQYGANLNFDFKSNELLLDIYVERLGFVKNAIEYSLKYLDYRKIKIKKFRLSLENDAELAVEGMKTGLGSSATSTVAAVAAILKFHNAYDKNIIYKISRYAHYMAQGSGSGFDIAAAVYGSHFFVSDKFEPGDFIKYVENSNPPEIKNFDWPSSLIPVIIFTGKSASTKELVQKVLEFKKKNSKKYFEFMKKYNQVNLKLKDSFEKKDILKIKQGLEESWDYRKKLGKLADAEIEPEEITVLIEKLKKKGAFTAGLIGAGGGDSVIALCRSEKDKEKLNNYLIRKKAGIFLEAKLESMKLPE